MTVQSFRRIMRFAVFCVLMGCLLYLCSPKARSEEIQGSFYKLKPALIVKLKALHKELGYPKIIITSGYRNAKHNKEVGGVKNSQHLYGNAVDIKVSHYTPQEVAHFAKMIGFVFTKTYKTWTHIDVRSKNE